MSKIYLFDAYGTLLDVNAAVNRLRPKLGENADAISALWRVKQLEYTWVRTLMKAPWRDFEALTHEALSFALARFKIEDAGLHAELMQLYLNLEAFDDVMPNLTRLKEQGARLGVLSNGSEKMLESAFETAELTSLLTHIISVDELEKYKSHKKVYALALKRFKAKRSKITFISSNRWDIAAASQFGFNTFWLNRGNLPDEYGDLPPSKIISTLSELN